MTGTQIKFAIDIAKQIKRKSNIPVIWGGTHPTLQGQQTLDSGYADAVCVGEGDYQFYYNVIENNFKGIWTTSKYANLDDLPDTPFHLINIENYIHNDMYLKNSPRTLDIGQTSRGCPFRCGFCIWSRNWRA